MNTNEYIYEPFPKLIFDKRRTRVKICPCGKSNKDGKFVPYEGHETAGFCHSCDQVFLPKLPKLYQFDNFQLKKYKSVPICKRIIEFIPFSLYQKQLDNGVKLYYQNHFIQWLEDKNRGSFAFDTNTIQTLINTYYLGNSGKEKYNGWVLFPYIDIDGNIRDIKVMDYNPLTGKRIKEPLPKCWFIAKEVLGNKNAYTVRCFFGEHLLKNNLKPVMIFESEATAIYSAPFFPENVCIATGGNNGCKWTEEDKCNVLKGRSVVLYPDIDAYQNWEQKAVVLRGYGINVQVSQLIKNKAIQFSENNGIDYIELVKQKFDLRDILMYKVLKDCDLSTSEYDEPISMVETHTGKKYDNMILAYIKTKNNFTYDLLFDQYGIPVINITETVKLLESSYKIKFSHIILGKILYLANTCIPDEKHFSV